MGVPAAAVGELGADAAADGPVVPAFWSAAAVGALSLGDLSTGAPMMLLGVVPGAAARLAVAPRKGRGEPGFELGMERWAESFPPSRLRPTFLKYCTPAHNSRASSAYSRTSIPNNIPLSPCCGSAATCDTANSLHMPRRAYGTVPLLACVACSLLSRANSQKRDHFADGTGCTHHIIYSKSR